MDAGRQRAEQLGRRRDAALRCEPLECGHRDPLDCTAGGCGEPSVTNLPVDEPAAGEPGDIAALWANAKVAWLDRGFPKYGSPSWVALGPEDPRRLAAALEAAEMWRKYGDEEELCNWLKRLSSSPEAVLRARSIAELDLLAKPKPPHQLRATPGWPPVAIPGQPGKYLTYRVQKAA